MSRPSGSCRQCIHLFCQRSSHLLLLSSFRRLCHCHRLSNPAWRPANIYRCSRRIRRSSGHIPRRSLLRRLVLCSLVGYSARVFLQRAIKHLYPTSKSLWQWIRIHSRQLSIRSIRSLLQRHRGNRSLFTKGILGFSHRVLGLVFPRSVFCLDFRSGILGLSDRLLGVIFRSRLL